MGNLGLATAFFNDKCRGLTRGLVELMVGVEEYGGIIFYDLFLVRWRVTRNCPADWRGWAWRREGDRGGVVPGGVAAV